jgi:hypothetical protein
MMILKTSRANLSSNDQLALDLPFAATKSIAARVGPTPTFTRGSGATYIGSDGLIHGVDTSTTSNTIGTGSRTFTLAATAGQDQLWSAGDAVEASNGSNFMVGTVTSYDAATQSLVCNMTSTGGSGTFTSWRIGYRGPRFDHDSASVCRGLLIEESRTNICLQSENFGTTWSNDGGLVAISLDQTTSPSGAINADKISENTTISNRRIAIQTQSFVSGTTYTFSCFVKAAERDFVQLRFGSAFGGQFQNFVIGGVNAGTIGSGVGATAAIQAYPNGWYRCSITATSATTGSSHVTIGPQVSSTALAWQPYVGTIGSGIFVWGAQDEVGSFPTSYIPTVASSVVRSADVCSITSSTLWNASEGTLLSKTIIPTGGFECYPANWQNFFGHRRTSSNTLSAIIRGGGNFDLNLGTFVSGSLKVACTHGGNLMSAVANGGSISSTSGTLALNPTVLGIGYSGSGSPINGPVDSIRYYRKRLSNAKLQAITA